MPNTVQLPPPFSGASPEEVPLKRAPLVRVIAQIRFPTITAISDPATVAPFQERIRPIYPIGEKQVIHRLALNAETAQAIKTEPEDIWRFQDTEKQWRVSLAPAFLALETTRYSSRKDFLSRMGVLVAALEQTINPRVTQRIGLRYIDRIEGDAVARVHELIKPDFLGSQRLFGTAIRHMLTDTQLNTEEGATITARWGSLPANATTDPNVLEPAADSTWVIDLDMFTDAEGEFTAKWLVQQLELYAKRIYAVLRFMVTPAFLDHYGRS
jgi:uncharacterized protein (TIGR04255 family)